MEGTLIEQAFTLMIVGMITVFAVLGLVISMGNALIRFVNKYVPEVETPAPKAAAAPASAADGTNINTVKLKHNTLINLSIMTQFMKPEQIISLYIF